MYLVSNFEPMPQFLHFLGYIIIMDLNIYFQVIILGHQVNHRIEKISSVPKNCWWEIVLHKIVFQISCLAKNVMICQICMTISIGQGPNLPRPNLTGPDLPHQGPNLPHQGPNLTEPDLQGPNLPQHQKCWDSICHQIGEGPICRGPICLERTLKAPKS